VNDQPTDRRPNRRDLLRLLGIAPVFGYVTSEDVRATAPRKLDAPRGSLTGTSVSVALEGDVVLVGTPASRTSDRAQVGSVTVYSRRSGSWEKGASLTPEAGGPHFGSAVAVDGSSALVGDPLPTRAGTARGGYVAVFTAGEGSWTRTTTLTRQVARGVDRFGGAVAIDGSTVLVGASAATTDREGRSGAAYVFSQASGSWRYHTTLSPDPGAAQFGTAVALDGGTAAVAGRRRGESPPVPTGEVTLFERSAGRWSRQRTLRPPRSEAGAEFGTALALDGDTLLVGDPTASADRGDNAGAVYAFTRAGGRWRHRQTVLPRERTADDQFGTVLALDGDGAVVGRRGRASPAVFSRVNGRWRQRRTTADHTPERTRTAVALDGTRALAGVAGTPDSAGGVRLFDI
jgi:hypothetical protein